MERSEIKPYIAKRVAKELHDGDVVNLGIGLPTMVPDYLDPSVKLTLQSENGFIGLAVWRHWSVRNCFLMCGFVLKHGKTHLRRFMVADGR